MLGEPPDRREFGCRRVSASFCPLVLLVPSVVSVSDANQWSMVIQGRIFEPAEGSPGREALIDILA